MKRRADNGLLGGAHVMLAPNRHTFCAVDALIDAQITA